MPELSANSPGRLLFLRGRLGLQMHGVVGEVSPARAMQSNKPAPQHSCSKVTAAYKRVTAKQRNYLTHAHRQGSVLEQRVHTAQHMPT